MKSEHRASMAEKLLALGLSALAAKLAMMAIEQVWTKALGRSVPGQDEDSSLIEKVIWIGLTAAGVGMAREAAKELAAPIAANND